MELKFETNVDVEVIDDGVSYNGKVKLSYMVDVLTAKWGIRDLDVIPDLSSLKEVVLFDSDDNEKVFDLSDYKYSISGNGTTPVEIVVENKKMVIHVEAVR